ncbi:hypothetical protein NQ176_g1701 [Zarea fungicola]|uniref:Uncharacterized protein n=1 Tax=Zarea fungicola TaxID=93591 RepID=A0ACC1NST1_9HYPO|nr:hypothetical protein NQ176_g1701 [Lecanicillium fungicola]
MIEISDLTMKAAEQTLAEIFARLRLLETAKAISSSGTCSRSEWKTQFGTLSDHIKTIGQVTCGMYDQLMADGEANIGRANIAKTLNKARKLLGKDHSDVMGLSILYGSTLPCVDDKRYFSALEIHLQRLQEPYTEYSQHLFSCCYQLHQIYYNKKNACKTLEYAKKLLQLQLAPSRTTKALTTLALARTLVLQGKPGPAINLALHIMNELLTLEDWESTQVETLAYATHIAGMYIGKTSESKKSMTWTDAAHRVMRLHHGQRSRKFILMLWISYSSEISPCQNLLDDDVHIPSRDLEEWIKNMHDLWQTMVRLQHNYADDAGVMWMNLQAKLYSTTPGSAHDPLAQERLQLDMESWCSTQSTMASLNEEYDARWTRQIQHMQEYAPTILNTKGRMIDQLLARGEKELALQKLEYTLGVAVSTLGVHPASVELYIRSVLFHRLPDVCTRLIQVESHLMVFGDGSCPNLKTCRGLLSSSFLKEKTAKNALLYAKLCQDPVHTPAGLFQAIQFRSVEYWSEKDYKRAVLLASQCLFIFSRLTKLRRSFVDVAARAANVLGACATELNLPAIAQRWYDIASALEQSFISGYDY